MTINSQAITPKAIELKSIYAAIRTHAFPGLWLWAVAAILCLIDAALVSMNPRLSINFGPMLGALVPLAFVPIFMWRLSLLTETKNAKYVRFLRCGLMVLFLIPAMASLAIFNHALMAIPFPFVDDLLTQWDRALGFDWLNFGYAIAYFPVVNFAMDQIYQFMLPALIMVGLHAIIVGRSDHATEFLGLVMFTGIFCIFVAMFFPCMGAMDHLADPSYKALFSKDTGNSFVPQLLEIRGAEHIVLNPLRLAGLAAFPSYHCVCGVLMIYGSRSTKICHLIATVFGVLLIAATPTFGGHYLSDLIAGGIVAVGFILAGRLIKKNYAKA